jgi:hypothetical protein
MGESPQSAAPPKKRRAQSLRKRALPALTTGPWLARCTQSVPERRSIGVSEQVRHDGREDMRRTLVIIVCFLIAAVLLWLHFYTRLPPGMEAKGGEESLLPLMELAGAAVSLLAGVASLGLKVVELRLKIAGARSRGR